MCPRCLLHVLLVELTLNSIYALIRLYLLLHGALGWTRVLRNTGTLGEARNPVVLTLEHDVSMSDIHLFGIGVLLASNIHWEASSMRSWIGLMLFKANLVNLILLARLTSGVSLVGVHENVARTIVLLQWLMNLLRMSVSVVSSHDDLVLGVLRFSIWIKLQVSTGHVNRSCCDILLVQVLVVLWEK